MLGTDIQGRDVLSRVIYGARISLIVAAVVLTTGGIVGTIVGIVAGYYGGQVDEVLMRIVDFTLAVPFLLIALVVVIVFEQSLTVLMTLLAIFSWGGFARQIRAETLSLKTRDYVAQGQVMGATTFRIMFRHIFPGVVNTLIVVSTLRVGSLILSLSILSYLGAGIRPPTAEWGLMVAQGRSYISVEWWITFFPGMAIFLTVFAMNFLGGLATGPLRSPSEAALGARAKKGYPAPPPRDGQSSPSNPGTTPSGLTYRGIRSAQEPGICRVTNSSN